MIRIYMLFFCLLLASCSKDENAKHSYGMHAEDSNLLGLMNTTAEKSGDIDMYQDELAEAEAPVPPDEIQKADPKIIRNGRMNFEVDELEKSKQSIDSLVNGFKGYYESENLNDYSHRRTYSLRIRVPNSQFDSMVQALENGVGELKNKSITAQDVTEEYTDLNVRLENNLAYLSQYREILRKAKTIKEILDVQEKIRRIEEEIESKKGRIKYLDSKVNFSTLNVEITQFLEAEYSADRSFARRVGRAFKNGVEMFVNFVVGLVNFWPFLLILAFIFYGRKRIFGIFKRKKKKDLEV